jgi:hypothetical protein
MVYTACPCIDGVNPYGQIPASEILVIPGISNIQNGGAVTAKIWGKYPGASPWFKTEHVCVTAERANLRI